MKKYKTDRNPRSCFITKLM